MTPEERNLVTELFDRLATVEDAPRDREAERLIQDGLRQAPNATYALVQTVLVQDEALKRAEARMRELETQLGSRAEPPRQGGFLESMRESVWGRREAPRAGSVPTVRPGGEQSGTPMGGPAGYRAEAQPMGQPPSAGGSFLGTAAATAVGVIGGSLLMNSMRSMMGGHQGGSAHAAYNPPGGSSSPWGGGTGGEGNLARDAGLDDIGRGTGGRGDAGRNYGLMDNDAAGTSGATDANDAVQDENDADDFDDAGDFGGDLGGDEE